MNRFENIKLNYIVDTEENGEIITSVKGLALSNIEKFSDYLSNRKHIKIDSYSGNLYKLYNIKNSVIEINKLITRYNSEFFKFDEQNNILIEQSDKFDFITRNNTHIIINSYYIDWSSRWCMIGEIDECFYNAYAGRINKIIFKCSGKYSNASDDFKKTIDIQLL
jgi:hypothetical protein